MISSLISAQKQWNNMHICQTWTLHHPRVTVIQPPMVTRNTTSKHNYSTQLPFLSNNNTPGDKRHILSQQQCYMHRMIGGRPISTRYPTCFVCFSEGQVFVVFTLSMKSKHWTLYVTQLKIVVDVCTGTLVQKLLSLGCYVIRLLYIGDHY